MTAEAIISLVFSLVTVGVSIATFVIGRKTASHAQGKEDGRIEADMEYIKNSLDSIRRSNDNIFSRLNKNSERLTRVEEGLKDARDRLDKLEKVS